MFFVGNDQCRAHFNVIRTQTICTFYRLLKQAGGAREYQELLGETRPGQRPKPSSGAAAEDDGNNFVFHLGFVMHCIC